MHFALGFTNIASVYNKKKIMRILTQIKHAKFVSRKYVICIYIMYSLYFALIV